MYQITALLLWLFFIAFFRHQTASYLSLLLLTLQKLIVLAAIAVHSANEEMSHFVHLGSQALCFYM